jgi:hypothetical protein
LEKTSFANRTASLIATGVMLPCQRATISSHDRPHARR